MTAGGRSAKFPLFLSSATEQVLALGISAGFGPIDDSALASVYLPKDPGLVLKQASASSTSEKDAKLQLVIQAMAGVHLVAAAEAMSLGAKVGLEAEKLYEIISTAAGASRMFVDRAPQMLSGKWTSKKTVHDVISELVRYSFSVSGRLLFDSFPISFHWGNDGCGGCKAMTDAK